MPKLKTHQSTRKRIRTSQSKRGNKFIQRSAGQDHFNARESGKTTKLKRRDRLSSSTNFKALRKLIPHS